MAKKTTTKAAKPRRKPADASDLQAYQSATYGVRQAPRHSPPPFSPYAGVAKCQSWMYAAARINAQAVAANPLRLYVRDPGAGMRHLFRTRPVERSRKAYLLGDAKRSPSRSVLAKAADFGTDFAEVTEAHPVTDLLRKVNPWLNGFDLTTWRIMALQQTGNAYIFVPQENPHPTQYWPMQPQWTRIVPDERAWIAGYIYGKNPTTEKEFSAEEVIHFRMPSLESVYYGTGYAQMAWSAINLLLENHEYDYSMAKNNARPDYMVVVNGQGATADMLDRFESKVEEHLRGRDKRGKFLTTTGQVDIKPLSFPPKDMAGRDDIVEEIAAIYGVPVSMLKANDPNLASAQSGFASWREQSVLPLCRLDEETLNQRLLPMFGLGDDAVLAYDDPVPANEVQDWQVRSAKFAVGAVTPNEIRIEDGDDPLDLPHMDEPFVGGKPVTQLDAAPLGMFGPMPGGVGEEPKEPPEPPEPDVPDDEEESKALRATIAEAVRAEVAKAIAASVGSIADSIAAKLPKPKAACSCGHERQSDFLKGNPGQRTSEIPSEESGEYAAFVESMRRIFGEQTREVLDIIATNAASPDRIPELVYQAAASQKWTAEISGAVRPIVEDALARGGELAARGLVQAGVIPEPVFEMTNPEVQRYVDRSAVRLAGGVNGTTVRSMRELLQDGLDQGETIDQLRTRIEGLGYDPVRAQTIARTESARAYMQGQEEAWKQSGVVKGKTWVLSPDACEFCRAAAAMYEATPVPVGTPFYAQGTVLEGDQGGKMLLDYDAVDGPPLHPQCFLPDTLLTVPEMVAAMRSTYIGEAFELTLSDGRRLAVTANHPVLTAAGLVPACRVAEGDYLIDGGLLQRVGFGDPHDEDVPASAEEIFDSASMSRGVDVRRVPVTSEHLHGDGAACHGHIDVVSPNGLLERGLDASIGEHLRQPAFRFRRSATGLVRGSDPHSVLVALSDASNRSVRGMGKGQPLLSACGRHADGHGLGSVALSEPKPPPVATDRLPLDSKLLRQLLDAGSGKVSAVEVVKVKAFGYSGHVYDFQSRSGLCIAGGAIVSNCRCSMAPTV